MTRLTLEMYVLLDATGVLGAIGDATLNKWAESDRIAWLLVSYAFGSVSRPSSVWFTSSAPTNPWMSSSWRWIVRVCSSASSFTLRIRLLRFMFVHGRPILSAARHC